MNQSELIRKVGSSMYQQVNNIGYATAVQTLMDMQILSKEDYERWRNGQVPYLEKVCHINLKKLASVLQEMNRYAAKNNLKPSYDFLWAKAEIAHKNPAFGRTRPSLREDLVQYDSRFSEEKQESIHFISSGDKRINLQYSYGSVRPVMNTWKSFMRLIM